MTGTTPSTRPTRSIPTDIDVEDGIDANARGATTRLHLSDRGLEPAAFEELACDRRATSLVPSPASTSSGRSIDIADNPKTMLTNEAVISVGNIIKVDGAAITPAKTAVGKTDADGLSTITVYSEQTGKTLTEAVADYPENPYPEQLFDHLPSSRTSGGTTTTGTISRPRRHSRPRPGSRTPSATATPARSLPPYQAPNVGEEKILTITLTRRLRQPDCRQERQVVHAGRRLLPDR